MKIDLTQLKIDFPKEPDYDNGRRRDYRVCGYSGDVEVGHVTVALLSSSLAENDDFWFEKKEEIWVPRPLAFFQQTEFAYSGQGINGRLLVLVNEETKRRYQMPLASSTNFLVNAIFDWEEHGFSERPAMRVWEKLEQEGLAYRRDCDGKPRWIMN